ncbi:Type 1 glutamine amidotransferase-like domain-containing protein [Virgibacillus sp. DJP39]|uniref:Type 1 glutamine amidotransferase-like domain-containing protein n=1 Tax=Virgibacillus sp. DJP39 TaxID=3409790 RepID=UPI003BB77A9C
MHKHLFLFGGGPPFTPKMASEFAKIAAEMKKPVAILFVERDGWEAYMPNYTNALREAGIDSFHILPLPSTSISEVIDCLKDSSGVVIGGGDTNLYADYIVDTAISTAIKERYELGLPVAGFSAGSLISPEVCILSPKDNVKNEFQQRIGLGLISNLVVSVHFSQWNDEEHLREASNRYSGLNNFGIDEETGIYFLNGQFVAAEGYGVYSIENDSLISLHRNQKK